MTNKMPTERQVLRCIYEMYDSDYPGSAPGENDPYIAIDVFKVAEELKCKPQLIFGYLYYHMDAKYKYKTAENVFTHLFTLNVGDKHHAINFPFMAAILANHNLEFRRQAWSIGLSLFALVLSAGAIVAQLVAT